VQSVLSAVVTYHLTAFQLSKWTLKKIDRIRCRFLWHGTDNVRRGHGVVHWKRVTRPKQLGHLSILDLERFNTALRLRWPWLRWTDSGKPWQGLQPPSTKSEMTLLRACTVIQLGEGKKTSFWHDRWVDGKAPKELVPALFKLAWWKNLSVASALAERKWMRGLRRMTSTDEVSQIVHLWTYVHQVQLTTHRDSIS
jgi:hypothetical protein